MPRQSFELVGPDGRNYGRITAGTPEQMQAEILKKLALPAETSTGRLAQTALGGKAAGVTTAADVAGYSQEDLQALVEREVQANELLSDAKRQAMANAIPLAAGFATAPFTASMSVPAALGTQAAVGAGSEFTRQLVAGEDPNAYRVVGEGALGAGFEGLGRAVGLAAKVSTGSLPKTIKPEDAAVFAAAMHAKAPLVAAEVTGGRLAHFFQRWADKSVWGEAKAVARKEKVAEAIGTYVTEAMDMIAKPTSPHRTAGGLRKLAEVVHEGWNKTAGVMFDEARAAAPAGKRIDMSDAVQKAHDLLARGGNLRKEMPGTLKELTPEEKVIEAFLNDAEKITPQRAVPSALVGPDGKPLPAEILPAERSVTVLTVEQATELRKLFNEKYYSYLASKDRPAARMLKEFEKTFDESLSRQVGGPNSPYMKRLEDAKKFYKEGAVLWNTTVMAQLLDKNPSKTIANVNVLDPQVQKTLAAVFTKWGNKQAGVDLVRRQALQNIIQDATMSSGGQGLVPGADVTLPVQRIKESLKRLEPESRAFIFAGKGGLEIEHRLAEAIAIAERVEKVQGRSADRVLSNLAMMAWGVAHQSGAMIGAAAASLTAPNFFARIMSEPVASLHLTRALKYAEKGFTSPRFWSLYAQEAARAVEAFRQTESYREMTGEAQRELDLVKAERQQKGIPQRKRPDR